MATSRLTHPAQVADLLDDAAAALAELGPVERFHTAGDLINPTHAFLTALHHHRRTALLELRDRPPATGRLGKRSWADVGRLVGQAGTSVQRMVAGRNRPPQAG